jgi:hypothetical protein
VIAALNVAAYEFFREFLIIPPNSSSPPEVTRA